MSTPSERNTINILDRANSKDRCATDALLPLVYEELKRLADFYLRAEGPAHTLQATALVHEAYLRLARDRDACWKNKAHFVSAAAVAIRRILIEHSRRRRRTKRGGDGSRVLLEETLIVTETQDADLLALDEALSQLSMIDPQKARIVELRFFGGLTVDGTAETLGISSRTAAREWRFAKAWLRREVLQGETCHD
ncbi:MAG: ECF-type sigma factor [Phycisphaerales bacterium]|nr:ECF-type sigma factor [Phycisphaerales bacterium]